jgi:predicted metal-binding membrane protein
MVVMASERPSQNAFFGVSALLFAASTSCCTAGLTAILLVLGVMDLKVMAVVTAAATVERLAPAGERIARGIGAIVVAAGLLLIARACL